MGKNPSHFKGNDQRPVERVSWDDAVEFCRRLSKPTEKVYRLPTEAEWEYACRAGTTTKYYFGKKIKKKLANYGNYGREITKNPFNYDYFGRGITKNPFNYERSKDYETSQTTAVGKYLPNNFGLYDMHGNVGEWCQDNWHKNYKGAPNDGSAWVSGKNSRVVRGGSWGDDPDDCRSAYRDYFTRDCRFIDLGFRVVCVAPRTT